MGAAWLAASGWQKAPGWLASLIQTIALKCRALRMAKRRAGLPLTLTQKALIRSTLQGPGGCLHTRPVGDDNMRLQQGGRQSSARHAVHCTRVQRAPGLQHLLRPPHSQQVSWWCPRLDVPLLGGYSAAMLPCCRCSTDHDAATCRQLGEHCWPARCHAHLQKGLPPPCRPAPFPLELVVAYPRYTYYDGQILNSSETPAQVTVLSAVSKQSAQTHTVLHRAARQGAPSARCRLGRRGQRQLQDFQLVWSILSCPAQQEVQQLSVLLGAAAPLADVLRLLRTPALPQTVVIDLTITDGGVTAG